MANLKTAGLRDLLEQLVANGQPETRSEAETADASTWTPTV
jgi:hypothetical protein